jgi:hypothetical protein
LTSMFRRSARPVFSTSLSRSRPMLGPACGRGPSDGPCPLRSQDP